MSVYPEFVPNQNREGIATDGGDVRTDGGEPAADAEVTADE